MTTRCQCEHGECEYTGRHNPGACQQPVNADSLQVPWLGPVCNSCADLTDLREAYGDIDDA